MKFNSSSANIALGFFLVCFFLLGLSGCPTSHEPSETKINNTANSKKDRSIKHPQNNQNWNNMMLDHQWVPAQNFADQRLRQLNMWVESIDADQSKTVIHAAVQRWSGDGNVNLAPASGAYIVDDNGRSYNLVSENRDGVAPFTFDGQVRPETIERFELEFPPLRSTQSIRLMHPQFLPLTIYRSPASIMFCSPKATFASKTTDISCDGNLVTAVPNGERRLIRFAPGTHACGQHNSEPALTLYLENGKRYYVQVRDRWFSKLTLTVVSKDENQTDDSNLVPLCMEKH